MATIRRKNSDPNNINKPKEHSQRFHQKILGETFKRIDNEIKTLNKKSAITSKP